MLGAYRCKTKKDFKTKVGQDVREVCYDTSIMPELKPHGNLYVVGPDPYNNRKWYSRIVVENYIIKRIN